VHHDKFLLWGFLFLLSCGSLPRTSDPCIAP
jgi:hypothetical protein